jgi:hypothetical protein
MRITMPTLAELNLLPWTRIELFAVLLLSFAVLYRPPGSFAGLRDLVERHFGDWLGMYMLHLGIGLVILGGFYPSEASVAVVGQSLILAAVAILKLKTVPGAAGDNGNGTPLSTQTTHTETVTEAKTVAPVASKPPAQKSPEQPPIQ